MLMIGKMIEANFGENKITLEMRGDYQAAAGDYVLMPAHSAEILRKLIVHAHHSVDSEGLDSPFRGQPFEQGLLDALRFLSPVAELAARGEKGVQS